MTEQLINQLQANLKYIENSENYFSMFKYVISSCTNAEFANKILHNSEALNDEVFRANAKRISEARQHAIKLHGEWTIRTLEQSKTKHTVRTFVSTLYSDIFDTELK